MKIKKEKGNKSLRPVKLSPIRRMNESLAFLEILPWFYQSANYTILKKASGIV